jgi:hypothetical protein
VIFPRILDQNAKVRKDARAKKTDFLYLYTICRRTKCISMWVVEGRITYRVYAVRNKENNVLTWFYSKVNRVSDFMGRHRSIQADI